MIFIACPEKFATGGTELLHQLYFKLTKFTNKVKIFYYDYSGSGNPVNNRFEKYNVSHVTEIEDNQANILIVPEVATNILGNYYNIKKCVWWLSVDNYFAALGIRDNPIKSVILIVKKVLSGEYFKRVVNFKDDQIIHLYQSFYAKDFLENKGVQKLEYLSDYIGSNFLDMKVDFTDNNRLNRVLYNPKKGFEFTRKIIAFDDNIEFIPLVNMKQDQIIELCKTSKVYIDFGNHPGKDRFPREAAHLGCIVITGKKGSARFEKDVKIPQDYKFNDVNHSIHEIINKILYIFHNYNEEIDFLNEYRSMIANEELRFEDDVQKIWDNYFEIYS
ncbi:hypothetical protein PaeBR_07740 [Paenibacillus sp. BR2-3]|uniref:hypothetical protein n=1 Tax=Paenibacillus sp. BR2-3 TaxID=3048494 RepID=UPI0039779BA3